MPLLIFISAVLFFYFGMKSYYIYFVAYLAAFHFIRQEYGWMKISSAFDKTLPNSIATLDKITTYTMTIVPFIWLSRKENAGFWYEHGDVFLIPDIIASIGLYFFWLIVFLFLFFNTIHALKTKTLNLSKFLVFINTFFGWYVSFIFIESGWIRVLYLICHHGIPYYFIVFRTERITQNYILLKSLGRYKYLFLYLACAIFMYFFIQLEDSSLIYISRKNYRFLNAFFYGFFLTPQLVHFMIDAFIWKKRIGLVKMIGSS
jgi:hypothetical protein